MADKFDLSPEIEKFYEKWRKEPQSRVFAQLADAYRKSGMLDEAISLCLEGLKLHPSYGSARMVLARAYQEKGMDSEAEMELWEVIGKDPNNILANRMLGDLLHREGKMIEALEQYKRVLKLTPLDREIKALLEDMEATLNTSPAPAMAEEAKEDAAGEGIFEPSPLGLEGREETPVAEIPLAVPGHEPEADDAFLTETLADLYLKQGLRERAVEIFSRMLASDADNSHLQERLKEAMSPPGENEATGESASSPQPLEESRSNLLSPAEEKGEADEVLSIPELVSPEESGPILTDMPPGIESEVLDPSSTKRDREKSEVLRRWLRAAQQRRQGHGE